MRFGVLNVNVYVIDINDNFLVFLIFNFNVIIDEDVVINFIIIIIWVIDVDKGNNFLVVFSISEC